MEALELAKRNFRTCTAALDKAYEAYTIDELANGYCKATDEKDEYDRDVYYSALMLRFWSKINKCYQKCRTLGITYEDCYSWVNGAISMACDPKNRSWQRPAGTKGRAHNAEQAINQILATRFVKAEFYKNNLKKNKGKNMNLSIDAPIYSTSGKAVTIADLIADESCNYTGIGENEYIIQDYVDQDKLVEAIILENISTKDVFKHSKHVSKEVNLDEQEETFRRDASQFWPAKLIKVLNGLDSSYVDYFAKNYKVNKKALSAAFETVQTAANQKKYKMIDATLEDFKSNLNKYYDLPTM